MAVLEILNFQILFCLSQIWKFLDHDAWWIDDTTMHMSKKNI